MLYEYAWGTTYIHHSLKTEVTGAGTAEELPAPGANAAYDVAGGQTPKRPLRVGAFAREGTTREQAGALIEKFTSKK